MAATASVEINHSITAWSCFFGANEARTLFSGSSVAGPTMRIAASLLPSTHLKLSTCFKLCFQGGSSKVVDL